MSVTFTSSLPTEREYVCPGETVTYICNGTGYEIGLYVPPHVSLAEGFSYLRGDEIGPGRVLNSVKPHLISTEEPEMVASVTLEGLSFNCIVNCDVRSPAQSSKKEVKMSGMSN